MKNLIKLFGILFLSLLVNSCSSIKVDTPKSTVSFYPATDDIDLVIDPLIISKQDKNSDISAILKSLKFLYKLPKDKELLNVGKIQYEDRFDNIIIKKDTKNNIQILKNMIETMSKNSNNKDFDFNGVILSSIDKKEPKENTLKIGFEIVDKSYPYLRGYRSIKEKDKTRYTEYIILQNPHGSSKNYVDMINLIKYFILMPVHKYHYKFLQPDSFNLIKEQRDGKLHIYRYTLKKGKNFRTFKGDYLNEIVLPKKLGILPPYLISNNDYCSIFDMDTHKANTFFHNLDNYPNIKSKYLSLSTQNHMDSEYKIEVRCEDKYIYDKKDTHLVYTKNDLDKIIVDNYIAHKINVANSPILDMSIYDKKLYLTTLSGKLVVYDIKKQNLNLKKISSTPLYKIDTSKNFICIGGAKGIIYVLDRLNLKKDNNYKVSKKYKISFLKFYNERILFYSFMNKWQSVSMKDYKKHISKNDFIIKQIGVYNDKIITGANFLKLWRNDKVLHVYPKESFPIVTFTIWKDNVIVLYWNNTIIKYNLKAPYNILETRKINLKDDHASDMVIYKDMYIIGTKKGFLYIVDKYGNKIGIFNDFGKINKLLYNDGKIYIATHGGVLYIFDIRLWKSLSL